MIRELYIENLALIDTVRLHLGEGLNVLTGETGAGKSILVDALNLLFGGRASTELLRHDSERALVECVVDSSAHWRVEPFLKEYGLTGDSEQNLILTREVTRTGRNPCRINGRTVTLAVFQEVGGRLLDLHGQNEQQSLFRPERQQALLDAYAGAVKMAEEVRRRYGLWTSLRAEMVHLGEAERERRRLLEDLEFQLGEIETARPLPGEDEDLARERELLFKATNILNAFRFSYDLLAGSDHSVHDALSRVLGEMKGFAGLVPGLQVILARLEAAFYEVDDLAREISILEQEVTADPARLEEVEGRLIILQRLKKKYGRTIEEVLAFRQKALADREAVLKQEERSDLLRDKVREAWMAYLQVSGEISRLRTEGAGALGEAVTHAMKSLALGGKLDVLTKPLAEPSPLGLEEIEFSFSPNPGEPPKPLQKIASGGELSRVMLALKCVLAEAEQVPAMVFDEVDAGVGGVALQAVAESLARLAENYQVLCVTHAPQIACFAQHHFFVEKKDVGGRTVISVREIDGREKEQEVARMLSGEVTETALAHAREMLEKAKKNLFLTKNSQKQSNYSS